MKKVLIITSSIDSTVDYMLKKYCCSGKFYRFNIDKFSSYEIIIGDDEQWVISNDEWRLSKKEVDSIYYRKPRLPNLDEYRYEYQNMISKDIISLVNGIVDDFHGRVLSKPHILRKTENKVFQLLYAKSNGLLIPNSFIGNSGKNTNNYIREKSIIKPITTGKIFKKDGVELYQTNYFEGLNENISLTPIYLQKYIDKNYEVRLTYIDGYFFSVRIDSEDKLDWRRNYKGLKYRVIDCPTKILNQCKKMLSEFKLNFGAFDFIVDKDNNWFFLEVNPNGQWLWLENELKLSISEKILNFLIREV